jgi:hypothetical protein
MTFQVGDLVKVIKVIESEDDTVRNDQKRNAIGFKFYVSYVAPDKYAGQDYRLGGIDLFFHADELEHFLPQPQLPVVGDLVHVVGVQGICRVASASLRVDYFDEKGCRKTGVFAEFVPPEVQKALLAKERDQLVLQAKEAMEKATKLSEKLAAMK